MPTFEEVDAVGVYGPFDTVIAGSATVGHFLDSTFEGKPLKPGNWYKLQSAGGHTFGMVEHSTEVIYAYVPVEVHYGLGTIVDSLDAAIRLLVGGHHRDEGDFSDDGESDFDPEVSGDYDGGYGPDSYFARTMEKDD